MKIFSQSSEVRSFPTSISTNHDTAAHDRHY